MLINRVGWSGSPNRVDIPPSDIIIKAANSLSLWFPTISDMNDSLLYKVYGAKDYSYASPEYKGNAYTFISKRFSPKEAQVVSKQLEEQLGRTNISKEKESDYS